MLHQRPVLVLFLEESPGSLRLLGGRQSVRRRLQAAATVICATGAWSGRLVVDAGSAAADNAWNVTAAEPELR